MRRKPLYWILLPALLATALLPLLAAGWWGWPAGDGAAEGVVWGLLAIAAGAVALAASAALWLARKLGRSLAQMQGAADRFAAGALEARAPVPDSRELANLARSFNAMAARLEERIQDISRRQTELETVLANMVEAVLVVDSAERVLNLNPSAARLFGVALADARGRYLMEVVRNADLIHFLSRTLNSQEAVAGEIVIHEEPSDRILQAHGNLLRDPAGGIIGAMVVLHDLTTQRKLETVRRDFVANVSHELKSPLTAIRGFVETLQDGALANPEEARGFLDIVARQAERLMAIVEDLLHLSRIEQEEERGEISLERLAVEPVLRAAIQDCESKAAEKNLSVELDCPEALAAPINPAKLEQAVLNLLDNAIKFSPAGSKVRIEARANGTELTIRVIDQGKGIPQAHQPRLFERFYRVDTARSRELGGTGLGLAIVKHITQAHGGRVAVESAPGKGAVFSIHLPA